MSLAWIARLTATRPGLTLLVFLLSLIPTGYLASGLKVDQDFGALLDPSHAAVQDLEASAKRIGGTAFAVVAIEANPLDRAKHFARELSPRLEALPSVLFVDGHTDVDFLLKRRLLYLKPEQLETLTDELAGYIDRRYAAQTGLFVDLDEDEGPKALEARIKAELGLKGGELPVSEYQIGKDGKYLYVFVRLRSGSGNLDFGKQAMKAIEAEVDQLKAKLGYTDMAIAYSGSVLIRAQDEQTMSADLSRSGLIGFFGVIGIMLIYTRRLRSLALVGLPLLVSTSWTFAFAHLAIGRLNIITGFLVAILLGLGVDFVIHLYLRYGEERRAGKSVDRAQELAITTTGRAVVSSSMTTAAAFFAVIFANFVGYSEFGTIAGVGILFSAGVTLFMFPALNKLLENLKASRVAPPSRRSQEGLELPRALRLLVLIGVPLFFAFSILQLASGGVRFHTNWRELGGESPAADFDDYIVESLGKSNTLTLLVAPDEAQLRQAEAAVTKLKAERKAKALPEGITDMISMATLVPPDQAARLEAIEELKAQLARVPESRVKAEDKAQLDALRQLTEVEAFGVKDVPASLSRRFQTVDKQGSLVVLVTDYLFYELDQVIDWADEMVALRAELDKMAPEVRIISENWVVGTVFKIVKGDGPFILWGAFVGVFLILLLDFRSLKNALVVLSTLILGMVSIAGAMSLFDLELNFINAVIMPSLVGIGIDGAIHVYHRYLDEGPGAMPLVLRHTSAATLLAAATTMMGFGSLATAHHAGIRSVGFLAIVGIGTTYVCTSVFFPLWLQSYGAWKAKRQAKGARA